LSTTAGGESQSSRFFPKTGTWRTPVTPNSYTNCHFEDHTFLSRLEQRRAQRYHLQNVSTVPLTIEQHHACITLGRVWDDIRQLIMLGHGIDKCVSRVRGSQGVSPRWVTEGFFHNYCPKTKHALINYSRYLESAELAKYPFHFKFN